MVRAQRLVSWVMSAALAVLVPAGMASAYPAFNGQPDNQIDQFGYYYAVSGGLFPTGTTPNGDNASGGTFRFITDDPFWGFALGTWHKDDWFPANAGIAVTLKNGATTVYDNNGLETGTFPAGFYTFGPNFPTEGAGAVTAYSSANNYDFIYAGYMQLAAPTTVTQLIGYFVRSNDPNDPLTGPFNPDNGGIRYHTNIWSNVAGDLLPTNTGSFVGDVFSSDNVAGSFSWSDTGYDRTGSTSQQDIYRLVYTLDAPITLDAGTYWFGTNVTVVPEPSTLLLFGIAAIGFAVRRFKFQ